MTGGPLKQGRTGVPISFPITTSADGTTVTRGIVRVRKPSGAEQSWACSVSGTSTTTSVTLLHVTESGDLDEVGAYGWTAYLYDGPDADDLVDESVDMRGTGALPVILPLTSVPT